jgi:L-asparaginase II
MSVPLAHVIRSGLVESVHYGSAVVVGADGKVIWSVGDVNKTMFPRSANKFMQTLAMVQLGLPLHDELLALACASHSGEEFQISGVRQILAQAGLTSQSLKCPADFPWDESARNDLVIQGVNKSPIYMNCSGKHAAMLLTCVVNKWDIESYCSPDHPLQHACKQTIEKCTGIPVEVVGVDGCGAPTMSSSLLGLARSFGQFAGPSATDDQRVIANALRLYPEYVAGSWRDATKLMQGLPGAIAKDGAEGVYGIGLGDGRALAVKIDDGAQRARITVAMSILRNVLGVVSQEVDRALERKVVLGGGLPVGKIESLV